MPGVDSSDIGDVVGELQVTAAALQAVAQEVNAVADETRSGLTTLDGQLQGLLGSGWTGQAGTAFGDVWHRWHEGAENMLRGLDTMAGLLEEAAQGYYATDTGGAAAVDSAGM
jgi:WXG100 family type VII secretion target